MNILIELIEVVKGTAQHCAEESNHMWRGSGLDTAGLLMVYAHACSGSKVPRVFVDLGNRDS